MLNKRTRKAKPPARKKARKGTQPGTLRGTVACTDVEPPASPPVAAAGGQPDNSDEPYLVTTYADGHMRTARMSRQHLPEPNLAGSTFYYSPAFERVHVVRPDGQTVSHAGGYLVGAGPLGLCLLFTLMVRPGRKLTPFEVAHIAGRSTLQIHQRFHQRLKCTRRAFGEGGAGGLPVHFLLTGKQPYGASWNEHCAYTVIEPESWLEIARCNPGLGWAVFHSMLREVTRLRDVG